jgi:chitin disaccharide deacetylase
VRIVVNADDFGASPETVRATRAAFECGAVTSATIMVTMPAAREALAFARSHPEHSFGVHLTFVGDGVERPASDPDRIPDLVDERGFLRSTRSVRLRGLIGSVSVAQIEREVEAQLKLARDHGIPISHVDSHRHLHKLAPFREALTRVLPQFGVTRVRNVQDIFLRRPIGAATYWIGPLWRRRLMSAFTTTEHFYMPASTGDVDWGQPLLSRLDGLDGSLEVGVHPGVDEEWRREEMVSAQAFALGARERGHALVSWSEVS